MSYSRTDRIRRHCQWPNIYLRLCGGQQGRKDLCPVLTLAVLVISCLPATHSFTTIAVLDYSLIPLSWRKCCHVYKTSPLTYSGPWAISLLLSQPVPCLLPLFLSSQTFSSYHAMERVLSKATRGPPCCQSQGSEVLSRIHYSLL